MTKDESVMDEEVTEAEADFSQGFHDPGDDEDAEDEDGENNDEGKGDGIIKENEDGEGEMMKMMHRMMTLKPSLTHLHPRRGKYLRMNI
jgi:hypothetical protein